MNLRSYFSRGKTLQQIIGNLENLKSDPNYVQYRRAVEINIAFFKAARSPITYIKWLIFEAPKLRKKREEILELADLPLPGWQEETHRKLIKLERLSFPGLLRPIKNAIIESIKELENSDSPIVLLSIGCGGMELEKQVISELVKANSNTCTIIIGVEPSTVISRLAISNLSPLTTRGLVKIRDISRLDNQTLDKLRCHVDSTTRFVVAVLSTDVFDLHENIAANSVDLMYHCRVKHHLKPEEYTKLNELAIHLNCRVIEFDDFCSVPVFVFPSIITWRYPVTLNGAILSYLRDPSKKELLSQATGGGHTRIYNMLGYYLRTYEAKDLNLGFTT